MQATTEQIVQAFQNLTPAQSLAIHKFAQRHVNANYPEPLDLVNEALCRSIEGRRNWPLSLPFSMHMVQTIRSIVSHEKKGRHGKQAALTVPIDEVSERRIASAWPSAEEQALVFEQVELARKAAERVKEALAADPQALKVLEGMLAGLSPRETCEHYGMSAGDFDAARHRVMRRLRDGALH